MEWDEYFLNLAFNVAQKSKDPSTKVGAVIVDQDKRVISTGYNGFPRCMKDTEERYANREEKYSRIIHAEMNALIFAKQSVDMCTLYTYPLAPCERCVVHMLQAGIQRFVFMLSTNPRWEDAIQTSKNYIHECGAEWVEYTEGE